MSARVAEFGRRTGLRIRRGNPWGFESPLSHQLPNRIRDSIGSTMKKIFFLMILFSLLQVYSAAEAQYYGYNYYHGPRPRAQVYRQYANPPNFPTYQFRLAPPPHVLGEWNLRNRELDLEALQRSPLNPESPNDYLLRNF